MYADAEPKLLPGTFAHPSKTVVLAVPIESANASVEGRLALRFGSSLPRPSVISSFARS